MTKIPHSLSSVRRPRSKEAWRAFVGRNRGWIAAGAGAAVIAGSAWFNRARARSAEEKTPPIGKFIEIDGIRLHYVEEGSGPAVIFLHGNGVLLQDFIASGVLGLAAKRHRVIAFDRPGFGYSERPRTTIWSPQAQADLLLRALQKIGVRHAVIVGHSWGTMVALAMALAKPEAVDGLVLISGYYFATARPDVVLLSAPALPVAGDLLAATVSPLAGRLLGPLGVKASFAPAPVSEKFAAFPVDMTLRPSQVRATAADTATMVPGAIALGRRYDELAMPIIAMAGEGDLIVHPSRHAERLAADHSNVELQMVPGQGHLLHYAVPEQVVLAIDTVLARSREHGIGSF